MTYNQPIDPIIKRNLAVVATHYSDEMAHNYAGISDSYTDDIQWDVPLRGIHIKGKAAAVANYHDIFDTLGNITFENLWHLPTKEYVWDRSIVRFTVTGPHFSGLPVGHQGELILFHKFRIRDGQICEEKVYEVEPGDVSREYTASRST